MRKEELFACAYLVGLVSLNLYIKDNKIKILNT